MARATEQDCDREDFHEAHRWDDGTYLYRCKGIYDYSYQTYEDDYVEDWDDWDDEE